MRIRSILLATGAALLPATAASAADQLKFGAAPSWVVPQAIPAASDKMKERPAALLLHDQQTLLEPGKISTFAELAFKIQKPEGLAAGNLSVGWNPAFDTVTINRLEIRRGNQVIDVLKSGQTFTTMRRESNLELAMLDGVLTANIQPEGLQEGDVVVLATTTEHVDPTLKDHVETGFAPWGEAQIGLAHAMIAWPAKLDLRLQKKGDLPPPQQAVRNGRKVYELTMRDVEPIIAPKGAPLRFKIGRLGEATDFRTWADAARLLAPLYRTAAVIPASGALRDEVEKIRKTSTDPKLRAEQALQLVQARIRYVALFMGQGGLVPATAETTWSRRFGDCKAKTALLLAILHEFGIAAEPVAANLLAGDAVADRLPMIGAFNHVLVRAHLAGKDYWLDGTRTGDTSLDRIQVPSFGWALPLVDNAALVHLVPPPLQLPDTETHIEVDATNGVFAPAKVAIEVIYRGDGAVGFNNGYAQLSADQRTEFLHANAKSYFDSVTGDSSTVEFNQAKSELRILTKGTAKLDWKDGWYYVPKASLAFTPDFDRPAGPQHDAPIATSYPNFDKRTVTIKLPPGFAAGQKASPPIHETLAGVEYERSASISGDIWKIESSERSIAPELPYTAALAAAPRLRALDKDDVYLRLPDNYRSTDKDLAELQTQTPASAYEYFSRASSYLDHGKWNEAMADLTAGLNLEPKDVWALNKRGSLHIVRGELADAEKDLTAAQTLDPDNIDNIGARGQLLEAKGDCAGALEAYGKVIQREPKYAFALGRKAICERALAKDEQALADAALALKEQPSWMDLRVLRANILLTQGKNDLVAKEAELLTAENPKSDFAFVAAGRIYARLNRMPDAMKAFDRALAVKSYAYIYLNRSQIRPSSDFAGRMADLDAALKVEPNNAEVLAEKARLLTKNGDYKAALDLLGRMKAGPYDRYAEVQEAIVLYKAGRKNEAQKLFQSARAQAKSSLELNNLCWTKATVGIMLDSALEDCREALKLRPGFGPFLDSLGMVLLKLGRLDEALDAYNNAVTKNTGAASLMGRAFVYLRKGDRAHADADAAAARKLSAEIDDTFAEYSLKFDEKAVVSATAK